MGTENEDARIIHNFDELFLLAVDMEQKGALMPISLKGSFPISIHIRGDGWDKRIDKRIAQYVLNLQSAMDDILEEYAPGSEKPLLKVESRDGSSNPWADISEILNIVFSKMNDVEIFISFIMAIAGCCGYFILSRYQDRKEHVELENEKTKQFYMLNKSVIDAIRLLRGEADENSDKYAGYERPMKNLINRTDDRDTIEIGDNNELIPAEIAKKCGPKRAQRSFERTTYADGNYTVNSRRYDEGEIVLELLQSGIVVRGYLSLLDDRDREIFIQSLDKHEKEDELPFNMDLQVNVIHTARIIKYAEIVGEGAPRKGKTCVPLKDILGQTNKN